MIDLYDEIADMPDDRRLDYAAHAAGYLNRIGEEHELSPLADDNYYDDNDAYPYGFGDE